MQTYEMIKFPSIESFAHVFRDSLRGLTVRPKIKLHGTNGGIVIKDGEVYAQSRNNVLVDSDNAGFAEWVRTQLEKWRDIHFHNCIIFGEWAGPGIQDGDAVTKIEKKAFFVFAIYEFEDDHMITEPGLIMQFLSSEDEDEEGLIDVHVLPWIGEEVHINFENAETFAAAASDLAEQIGAMDPYIKQDFDVEGPGEGLVYMPTKITDLQGFCRSTFKVKCEAHRVKKSARAVSVKIDIPKDAVDFVLTFVTPARCQQAVTEACNGNRAPELTRDFLKWMGNDVRKESLVELECMNVEWGSVAKFVNDAARKWFLAA